MRDFSPTHTPSYTTPPKCSTKWPYSSGAIVPIGSLTSTSIRESARRERRAPASASPPATVVVTKSRLLSTVTARVNPGTGRPARNARYYSQPSTLRGDVARHGRFPFPPRLARGHGRRRRRGGAPARLEPNCPAGTRRTRPHPSAHVYQRSVYAQPRPGVHAVQFRLSGAVCRVRGLPLRLSRVHPRECLRSRRRPHDRRAHADRSRDSRHRPGVGGGPTVGDA